MTDAETIAEIRATLENAYLKAVAVVAAHGTMSEEYLTLTDEALTTIAKLVWPKEDD